MGVFLGKMVKMLFFNLALILLMLASWLTIHRPANPTQAYRIVFISTRNGYPTLYDMLPDGHGERYQLLLPDRSAIYPANSRYVRRPTDSAATYVTEHALEGEATTLYEIVLAAEEKQQIIAQSTMPIQYLLWSDDGQRLAYEKKVQDQNNLSYSELLVYDTATQETKLILRVPASCRHQPYFSWTKDNTSILTHHSCGVLRLTNEIYRIQIDPLVVQRLSNLAKDPLASANSHAWSSPTLELRWQVGRVLLGVLVLILLGRSITYLPIIIQLTKSSSERWHRNA